MSDGSIIPGEGDGFCPGFVAYGNYKVRLQEFNDWARPHLSRGFWRRSRGAPGHLGIPSKLIHSKSSKAPLNAMSPTGFVMWKPSFNSWKSPRSNGSRSPPLSFALTRQPGLNLRERPTISSNVNPNERISLPFNPRRSQITSRPQDQVALPHGTDYNILRLILDSNKHFINFLFRLY